VSDKQKAKALADAAERARKSKTLGEATASELCQELRSRDGVDEDFIIDAFGIDPEEASLADYADEIHDIYEAVAAGRTSEALASIYALASGDVTLLHPNSMLRLRSAA
jgi:hypothetical protein